MLSDETISIPRSKLVEIVEGLKKVEEKLGELSK